MQLLVNLDVPDLDQGIAFYTRAFELRLTRRIPEAIAELVGGGLQIYLLAKAAGTTATTPGGETRDYARHWTPVHLDLVVDDLDATLERALSAGARLERPLRTHSWGRSAVLADPFGHGFCVIQFLNRGYDELPWEPAE
jgi:predicted enzyme related to lactoylglutathione lyase